MRYFVLKAALVVAFVFLSIAASAQTTITPTTPSQDADGCYLISNAAELYGFAEIVNNGNATANAKLTADITVNENVLNADGEAIIGDFVQWTPIGEGGKVYSGTFDGQGHTISGLYASGDGWCVGFIGEVSGSAVVKNLGIVDSYFNSSQNFLGSIVGDVNQYSSVTLANVYSTSTVKGNNYIGGLVGGGGLGSVTVINSFFAGKTSASSSYADDLVSGNFFDNNTLNVYNAFVLGTSQCGTSVAAEQLSDGTVAAALHYYQDALADGSMFGISNGKTTFSVSLEGVSVTTADITLHTFDGDATAYSSKYVVGITTPLPVNVVREGYKFTGWYDNADLEGDAVTTISSSEKGNKEYWAKFQKSHSVTFVLNEGTIQKGEIDHYIEGKTTALPTFVTKGDGDEGASFEGWFTEEDYSGSRYYSIPSSATEDMTFYAKWGEKRTTFYLRQTNNAEPVNILYEGENVVYLDETGEDGEYYVIDEGGSNAWGDPIDEVPYTGGEYTFGISNLTSFNVAQSGFYVFTLTDKGDGHWFISILWSIHNCTVATIPDQTYTGEEIKPEIIVKDGNDDITDQCNFSFANNEETGTATVTITAKDGSDYSGEISGITFEIVAATIFDQGALKITMDQSGKHATLDGDFDTDDILAYNLDHDIKVDDITITRTFNGNSTIILPFSVNVANCAGGTFCEFTKVDYDENRKVWYADATEIKPKDDPDEEASNPTQIEANHPYIFQPSGANATLKITGGVTIGGNLSDERVVTVGDWLFVGRYKSKKWDAQTPRDYGFAGSGNGTEGDENYIKVGDFIRAGARAHIKPFRCYLHYEGNESVLISKSATVLPDRIEVRIISSVIDPKIPNPSDGDNPDDIQTPTSELSPTASINVWSFDKTIYIAAAPGIAYRIIDANGRPLRTGITATDRDEIHLSGKADGIVIVNVGGKSFKIRY